MTTITIAGVGPGDPELVTVKAIKAAQQSDVIIVPRADINTPGLAESIIACHISGHEVTPMHFPMTRDPQKRDAIIRAQVSELRTKLEGCSIFFPVIGDSVLYSTGMYFLDAARSALTPPVKFRLIPGVSAHSLAASCAKRFLAMSDDILTIIPGTASPEKISSSISHSDSAAIYKPTAIRDINSLIDPAKFRDIVRVEHAGNPERERIITGQDALSDADEYLSVILLHR